jgi:hypothetical protein
MTRRTCSGDPAGLRHRRGCAFTRACCDAWYPRFQRRHYFDCAGTILACYDALARWRSRAGWPNPQKRLFSVGDLDAAHARAVEARMRELTAIEVRPWASAASTRAIPSRTRICFVDSQTLFTGEHTWAGTPQTT